MTFFGSPPRTQLLGLVTALLSVGCGDLPDESIGEDDAPVGSLQQGLRLRPSDPLEGLTEAERQLFFLGRAEFEREMLPRDGLGPVFTERACAACHLLGGLGGADALVDANHLVRRFATVTAGVYDPLAALGGDVQQTRSLAGIQPGCAVPPEVVPAEATLVALRNPLPVFGDGLIDAIPEATILGQAVPKGDGVSGRPNLDGAGHPGRFGWKAQINNLLTFSANAASGTLSLTTALFPNEQRPQGQPVPAGCTDAEVGASTPNDQSGAFLFGVTAWQAMLAPVAQGHHGPQGQHGRRLFAEIGCAKCHVPEMATGEYNLALRGGGTMRIEALSNKPAALYSDLILHDMGPGLDEQVVMRQARGSEFRTTPLWGLGLRKRFLHDGRARTVDQAIALHGGEGTIIRDRYLALSDFDRRALLKFLHKL